MVSPSIINKLPILSIQKINADKAANYIVSIITIYDVKKSLVVPSEHGGQHAVDPAFSISRNKPVTKLPVKSYFVENNS